MAADVLALRSAVLQAVRGFFVRRGFLEVETPVRLRAPAPERHIEAIPSGTAYLRPSPELHMKRLLAGGRGRLFQMGPCFRHGESGRLHRPEYTMLEWYRADADYLDLLVDAKALLPEVSRAVLGKTHLARGRRTIELEPVWECLSVREAFLACAGWDPLAAFDADRFDLDLVSAVEPRLPADRPVVLKDYPAALASLARLKPGDSAVAERWELYVAGLELVNAFSELTHAREQRARFEAWNAARAAAGRPVYPLDEDFLSALAELPPSAGAALGVDRLVMLLAGAESIEEVCAFPVDG